jgi:hypothetical protein
LFAAISERAIASIYTRLEQPDVFDSIIDYRSQVKADGGQTAHLQHNTFEGMLLAREKGRKAGSPPKAAFTASLLNLKIHLGDSQQTLGQQPKRRPGDSGAVTKKEAWQKVYGVRKQLKMARSQSKASLGSEASRLEKQKTMTILQNMDERRPWHRDKNLITYRLYIIRSALAIISTIGTCLTLVQNEMVIVGYGSIEMLNICKAMNTGCSLVCVFLLVYMYWIQVQLDRVLLHVHQFRNMQVRSRVKIGMKRLTE